MTGFMGCTDGITTGNLLEYLVISYSRLCDASGSPGSGERGEEAPALLL